MKNVFILTAALLIFSGCNELTDITNIDIQGGTAGRKWTFIIYMAADNDLESAAIADFNELEAVRLGGAPVSIIVLLDRSPDFDATNGNWSGARVFEIKSDPRGLTSTFVSAQIDCLELGLTADTEIDLNTADPLVLSRFIDFSKRVYPAEQYALFIWGHGNGWRGGVQNEPQQAPLKAIAFDDTRAQYMSLPSFGSAVAGKGLSVIAFDTCYAAILEVVYQIKNDAVLFVGSESPIPSTGWDYTALFNDFLQKPSLSINDLGDSIQNQFSLQYAGLSGVAISQIQLSQVDNLFTEFDVFAGAVSEAVTNEGGRRIVLDEILTNVESYYFTAAPSDLFIDIFDFSKKITAVRTSITSDEDRQNAVSSAANNLETALKSAVPSSWARNGSTGKIGVFVIPLQEIGVPLASHDLAYVNGSLHLDKSAFVNNSQHWVPNAVPKNDSLLDKLFYWTY